MDALWARQYTEFQSHMKSVANFSTSQTGDVKDLAQKASNTDRDYIAKVVNQTRSLLNMVGGRISDAVAKQILLKVVLNMCTIYHQLDSWQRNAITDEMLSGVIAKLIVEVVQKG